MSADCILNATGRAPVVDGLDLETVGVDFDRKGIKDIRSGKDQRSRHLGMRRRHGPAPARACRHAGRHRRRNNMFGKKDRIRYECDPFGHLHASRGGERRQNRGRIEGVGHRIQKIDRSDGHLGTIPRGERRRSRNRQSACRSDAMERYSACMPSATFRASSSSPLRR